MRKTFCDRCGTECVNFTGRIHISSEHHTKQGEEVGMDEYRPAELCKPCADGLLEYLGPAVGRLLLPNKAMIAEMEGPSMRPPDVAVEGSW